MINKKSVTTRAVANALARAIVMFVALIVYLLPGFASAAEGTVYFNATLIDPVQQTRTERGWLHVQDGVIADLGSGEHPDADVKMDLGGGYVLPGLIDAHLHLTVDEDPIANISAVRSVRQVVQSGKLFCVDALREQLQCQARHPDDAEQHCATEI